MQGFSHNSLRIEPFLRFVEAALLALEVGGNTLVALTISGGFSRVSDSTIEANNPNEFCGARTEGSGDKRNFINAAIDATLAACPKLCLVVACCAISPPTLGQPGPLSAGAERTLNTLVSLANGEPPIKRSIESMFDVALQEYLRDAV